MLLWLGGGGLRTPTEGSPRRAPAQPSQALWKEGSQAGSLSVGWGLGCMLWWVQPGGDHMGPG